MADSKSLLTMGGLKNSIASICEEIRRLYSEDDSPWIIGYSGGKDSTAVLQLTWLALQGLPDGHRRKTVHVISTDTLVENPIVSAWVENSHRSMRKAAVEQGMPIEPHQLRPEVENSFWVNLIGKGYPAPRPKFRWCTERLKIKPSNKFITETVRGSGEAVLLLGTRKAESVTRARTMERHEKGRVRDRLSPNASLPGCWVYTPIEDWTNDDVWLFLTSTKNPWGWSNHDLMGMYAGATEGGECPLVVDTSTPSCGDSRFGCWVCTLVDKDRSMSAMIQNDEEKEWMLPLLRLRNQLDIRDDNGYRNDIQNRDFCRMDGRLTLERSPKGDPKDPAVRHTFRRRAMEVASRLKQAGRVHGVRDDGVYYLIHGPYVQSWREQFLRQLLETEDWVRKHGPEAVQAIELITLEELQAIRRIWVEEKAEFEDSLPIIYQEVKGEPFPAGSLDDSRQFGAKEVELLREAIGDSTEDTNAPERQLDLARRLIEITRKYRTKLRRAGLFDQLESVLESRSFSTEEEALAWAIEEEDRANSASSQAQELYSGVLILDGAPESFASDEAEMPEALS